MSDIEDVLVYVGEQAVLNYRALIPYFPLTSPPHFPPYFLLSSGAMGIFCANQSKGHTFYPDVDQGMLL